MIETLGDTFSQSWRVHARCERGSRVGVTKVGRCEWSGELDLRTPVVTRGREFPLDMLASRLKCPRCGSRTMRVIWSSPSGTAAAMMIG